MSRAEPLPTCVLQTPCPCQAVGRSPHPAAPVRFETRTSCLPRLYWLPGPCLLDPEPRTYPVLAGPQPCRAQPPGQLPPASHLHPWLLRDNSCLCGAPGVQLRAVQGRGLSLRPQRRELGTGASSRQPLPALGRDLPPSPCGPRFLFLLFFLSSPVGLTPPSRTLVLQAGPSPLPSPHTVCLCCSPQPSDSLP